MGKNLKAKIESTVDRVNSKAESKLLAVKAIEELIGFGGTHENFVEQSVEEDKEVYSKAADSSPEDEFLELEQEQEHEINSEIENPKEKLTQNETVMIQKKE